MKVSHLGFPVPFEPFNVLLCFIVFYLTIQLDIKSTVPLRNLLFLTQLNTAVYSCHLQVGDVRELVALWLGEENEHVHLGELFEKRVQLLANVVVHLHAQFLAVVVPTVHLGAELFQD